jgi:hypothetical protein
MWDGVIGAYKSGVSEDICFSASTIVTWVGGDYNGYVYGIDPANNDELLVEVVLLTTEAEKVYKPMYKSYIETRKYEPIPELDSHIKSVKFILTTDLAIKMFNDGYNKI